MTGIGIFRVADGRVAEGWGCFDTLSVQLQLGATLTPPAQPVR
jgi:hypothetical protein